MKTKYRNLPPQKKADTRMVFSPMGGSSASLVASEMAARAVPFVFYDRHNTKMAAVSERTMQISTEPCSADCN